MSDDCIGFCKHIEVNNSIWYNSDDRNIILKYYVFIKHVIVQYILAWVVLHIYSSLPNKLSISLFIILNWRFSKELVGFFFIVVNFFLMMLKIAHHVWIYFLFLLFYFFAGVLFLFVIVYSIFSNFTARSVSPWMGEPRVVMLCLYYRRPSHMDRSRG